MALTFIPNPNKYPIVCHKDNNPTNNKVENLYWGTQKENMRQMVADNRQRKSKVIQYKQKVLELHNNGFSTSEIMGALGLSKTSVRRLITGKL